MQPEEVIVAKPEPFDAEKFLVHLKKLHAEQAHEERKEVALTPGLLGNDEERVRDAIQRESYWRAQIAFLMEHGFEPDSPDMLHAEEELAHCLFTEGRIAEALEIAKNPERRAYYETIQQAIDRDDGEFCDCPESEEVILVGQDDITKKGTSQLWHTVGYFPSQSHSGQMTPIQQCAKCGFTNVTNL